MEEKENVVSVNDFEIIGKDLSENQRVVRPTISFWQDAIRRFKSNKLAIIGLIGLVLLIFLALFGKYFTKFSEFDQDLDWTFAAPFKHGHIFGTDNLGRDLWARTWQGAKVSLMVGLAIGAIDISVGSLYGGISGYYGGRVDEVLMRIVDVLYAIPYMLIVILFTVVFSPGVGTIILAMTVTGWTGTARLVRGQVLQLKEQEFVMAAKVLGANSMRIITKHLLPNILGIIIVQLTLDVPGAIFGEAFLSFLGLGIPIPNASLGSLIFDGYGTVLIKPYLLFIPALILCVMMLTFNFVADGLRDALDPKMRK